MYINHGTGTIVRLSVRGSRNKQAGVVLLKYIYIVSWLWEKQRTSLWLVVLVCENYRDFTSPNSAFDIAEAAVRQKVGPEATIDYRRANQYFHDLHLMDGAHVFATGLCHAWHLRFGSARFSAAQKCALRSMYSIAPSRKFCLRSGSNGFGPALMSLQFFGEMLQPWCPNNEMKNTPCTAL